MAAAWSCSVPGEASPGNMGPGSPAHSWGPPARPPRRGLAWQLWFEGCRELALGSAGGGEGWQGVGGGVGSAWPADPSGTLSGASSVPFCPVCPSLQGISGPSRRGQPAGQSLCCTSGETEAEGRHLPEVEQETGSTPWLRNPVAAPTGRAVSTSPGPAAPQTVLPAKVLNAGIPNDSQTVLPGTSQGVKAGPQKGSGVTEVQEVPPGAHSWAWSCAGGL